MVKMPIMEPSQALVVAAGTALLKRVVYFYPPQAAWPVLVSAAAGPEIPDTRTAR
jgi:hypothetical protein